MLNMQELDHARQRWQVGHHLFFAYVQSLILICDKLQKQVDVGDLSAARASIEEATYLMWGISVSFKLTGRRVFAMAPIHHHYELKGWAEPKIIVRFWIVAIILALVSLTSLKLR